MTNSFQRTFQHLRTANDVVKGPPLLQPAPSEASSSNNVHPTLRPPPPLQQAPSYPQSSTNLQNAAQPSSTPAIPNLHPAPQQPTPSTQPSSTLEFVTSVRGKPKLLHEGYTYVYHKDRANGNVAWKCDQNNKVAKDKGAGCNATAVTTGTTSTSNLEYAKPHSHPPAPGRVGADKLKNKLKGASTRDSTAKPHRLVAESLADVPADVNNSLPENSSLKRMIQRKRKEEALAANPGLAQACDRSLWLLYIPLIPLTLWTVFDSGPGDDRIIMLTTLLNLDFLCESVRLCGDGTFKAAPVLWYQLYTIHGQKNGYTVPCVFALLPNKTKETYVRLFQQLKSWMSTQSLQWLFSSFLSDFEQGAYLAMLEVFPGIGEEGCFFHLCKRLDYHVKKLGLSTKYEQDYDFRMRVKKLAALAFVPVADVVAVFESLATTFLDDELRLLSYFETTWIGAPAGGRRLPPLFPHHMWNVLDRSSTGASRTTNALEAYHHTFNSLLACQKPTIWKLLYRGAPR